MSDESGARTPRKLGFWPVAGTLSVGAAPIIIAELYVNYPGNVDELIALVGAAVAMAVWIQRMPQTGKSGGSGDE